jgi:predicted secreted protein
MNPAGAVVIFVLVWWCAFFAMLPIGVKGRWESTEDGVEGADPGAPADPNLKKKALWATIVALPVTAAVVAAVVSGLLNFRD